MSIHVCMGTGLTYTILYHLLNLGKNLAPSNIIGYGEVRTIPETLAKVYGACCTSLYSARNVLLAQCVVSNSLWTKYSPASTVGQCCYGNSHMTDFNDLSNEMACHLSDQC